MTNRVTLRDVAQYAGVSVTTVSNVVRGWTYVADDTRLKVQNAIRDLGYSPHPIAQGLRTGQMQTIGFIVPDLANPYFASIVSVAEDVAQEQRYTVIVFNSHEDEAREAECVRRATNRMVDGVLIAQVASGQRSAPHFKNLPVPVVTIDRIPDDNEGASCTLDNVRVGELATEHLLDLGHRRVAHLAGPLGARPARDRLDGYLATTAARGLDYRRVIHCGNDWGCDNGYQAMRALLADAETPTAVFASNDRVAIGALHAIHDAGLDAPRDLSIVGVDDIEVSEHLKPALTTVRQPLHEMAHAGIHLLLKLIREEAPQDANVVLEPSLVVRQSTAPPRGGT
jgi:LacI family transcriptional regulator